jgi:hypothetical protein
MRFPQHSVSLTALLATGIGLSFPGCGATKPTEIVLEVYTDLPCPAQAGVAAGRAGELGDRATSATSNECDPETGSLGRLVVIPRADQGAEVALEIRVSDGSTSLENCVASKNYAGCIVARRILNFIPQRSVRLRVDLRNPCLDTPCDETTTCVAFGVSKGCVAARVDPNQCDGVCTDEDLVDQHRDDFVACGDESDPCGEGATCILGLSTTPLCVCPAGFALEATDQSCTEIDECAAGLHDCHEKATCTNTAGSFQCTCQDGYAGNGRECESLCPTNCSPNATCKSVSGQLRCVCDSGFTGSGTTCNDVNECTLGTHDCAAPATCVNETGSFRCECPDGFSPQGGNACVCTDSSRVACAGTCIDPDTNNQYCGASGTCSGADAGEVCTGGRLCNEGQCAFPVPSSVLVFSATPEIQAALERIGVTSVSITAQVTEFVTMYDSQEWDLVIADMPGASPSSDMRDRLAARAGSGRILFNFWDLDADSALLSAFEVACTDLFDPPDMTPIAGAPVNLFDYRESFPAPLTRTNDSWNDNGDVLTLTGTGNRLVSRDAEGSEAVIVQTNGGRTIVNGFLPDNYSGLDADADEIADMAELFVNEITWLYQ